MTAHIRLKANLCMSLCARQWTRSAPRARRRSQKRCTQLGRGPYDSIAAVPRAALIAQIVSEYFSSRRLSERQQVGRCVGGPLKYCRTNSYGYAI